MKPDYYFSELRAVEAWKHYAAELVPCSGSMQIEKLDVIVKDIGYRISNKYTIKSSASVSLKDWDKDEKQAMFNGAKLFRRIELAEEATGKVIRTFIVIEEYRLLELLASRDGF